MSEEIDYIEDFEQWFAMDTFALAADSDLCVLCGEMKSISRGIYVRWRFSEHDFVCFGCFNDYVAWMCKNWDWMQ